MAGWLHGWLAAWLADESPALIRAVLGSMQVPPLAMPGRNTSSHVGDIVWGTYGAMLAMSSTELF